MKSSRFRVVRLDIESLQAVFGRVKDLFGKERREQYVKRCLIPLTYIVRSSVDS